MGRRHGRCVGGGVRPAWIAVGILLGLTAALGADTITWTGGVSTNWYASGNWTNSAGAAAIPASGDDVVIDGAARQPTLSLSGGATNINSLSIGANNASTLTVANADASLRRLIVAGACMVGPTGVLTHADNTTNEAHKVNVEVQGNLTIAAGGAIDVTALGYDAQKGPGYDTRPTLSVKGGAHGGQGRGYGNPIYYPCGETYGSATAPTNLGSGGLTSAGGGAVILNVWGTATVGGSIVADGTRTGGSPGAGGSVFLTAGAVTGSGAIRANGYGPSTGAAGGGRIAVVVTNGTDAGSVVLTAYGGAGGYIAAAGTVYVKAKDDTFGRLFVDNNGKFVNVQAINGNLDGMTGLDSPTGATSYQFDRVTITNCGILLIRTNVTLDLSNNPSWVCDSATNIDIRARLVFDATEGSFAFPAGYTFTNITVCQRGTNQVTWTGNIGIGQGAILTHEKGAYISTTEVHKLNLAVNGNLSILAGGTVWVSGNGYAAAKGPGYQAMSVSAGAYGGEGRGYDGTVRPCGVPYGSVTAPVNLGSGGGSHAGGGAALLSVSGTTTVHGVILANATNSYRSGSGGTVFITSHSLDGTGRIETTGLGTSGAGGGGRIAIILTNGTTFGSVSLIANGGTGASYDAAGGTIYLKTPGQAHGTLVITNHNVATTSRTLISSNVTDAVVGDVIIRTNGQLAVAGLQSLDVYGSWSNGGVFVGHAGSTVRFAGTNAATVLGSTAFADLVVTTAAKRVDFEAGKTFAVSNSLTFAGTSGAGNLLDLNSTVPGTQWKLAVVPGSAQSVSYVDVQDSDARGGDPIATLNCVNSGNNSNWSFASAGPITWTGGSNTLWGEGANWDQARPPIPTDTEVIIAPAANQPVLDAHREIANALTIQSGAHLSLAGYNLTVGSTATVAGALAASGMETLTFESTLDMAGGSFTAAQSTVLIAGSAAQAVTPAGAAFHTLLVTNAGGIVTFADGFEADSVLFDGSAAGATFGGSFTTTLFRCEAAGADLTFGANASFAVTDLMLRGASGTGNEITLRSTSDSTQWYLAVSGWRFARYVDVKDSDALGGQKIYAADSTNSGNSENWDFSGWHVWTGTASSSFTDTNNWASATAPGEGSFVLIDGNGANGPVVSSTATIARLVVGPSQATTFAVNTNLVVTDGIMVMEHGTITHSANPAGTAEPYKLQVDSRGPVTILAGGSIDVSGKGFPAMNGPGYQDMGSGVSAGAYGGQAAGYQNPPGNYVAVGRCYGSFLQPTSLGSGGAAHAGGGAIRLAVDGVLDVRGSILSEGDPVGDGFRTGSGGSIWITAGALAGTGTVSVKSHVNGAGGGAAGGGRMAIYLTNATDFGSVALTARGSYISSYRSAAGSIYLKHANDAKGRIVIDNEDIPFLAAQTELPPSTNANPLETWNTPFVMTNTAHVVMLTNGYVGDLFIYSTNAYLTTSNSLLYVNAREHDLTNALLEAPGPSTNRVDKYASVIWVGPPPGTLIMLQ